MKTTNPLKILKKIDDHYNDLIKNYSSIETLHGFLSNEIIKKAVLFDLFQIGEQINNLPEEFLNQLNKNDIRGLISIKNHIVHGYDQLDYQLIKNTIEEELFPFIQKMKELAMLLYQKQIKSIIHKVVTVYVDRPMGCVHKNIVYKLNYGYIKDIIAPDYEYQDAYIIDINEPIKTSCVGKVIAIIHRKDDIEDKLVVAANNKDYSIEQIKELTNFQEQFFDSEVIK